MLDIVEVKSIVSGNKRQVSLKDTNLSLEIGDIILIGRDRDNPFGSFDVGRIEKFSKINRKNFLGKDDVYIIDNITHSSKTFKKLKRKALTN